MTPQRKRTAATNAPAQPKDQPDTLKGWQQIATFLGQPVNVAQRWAKQGMPVTHQGRAITASVVELKQWLGREAGGEPIHVVESGSDLAAELRRGLSHIRREKRR